MRPAARNNEMLDLVGHLRLEKGEFQPFRAAIDRHDPGRRRHGAELVDRRPCPCRRSVAAHRHTVLPPTRLRQLLALSRCGWRKAASSASAISSRPARRNRARHRAQHRQRGAGYALRLLRADRRRCARARRRRDRRRHLYADLRFRRRLLDDRRRAARTGCSGWPQGHARRSTTRRS